VRPSDTPESGAPTSAARPPREEMRRALRVLAAERGIAADDDVLDSALDRYEEVASILRILREDWLARPADERPGAE
jgi:hypothetical protein